MTLAVATPMAKKTQPESNQQFCEYTSLKIDVALLKRLKHAAVDSDSTIQEKASDLLNNALAKELGVEPIQRLPPKPRRGDE